MYIVKKSVLNTLISCVYENLIACQNWKNHLDLPQNRLMFDLSTRVNFVYWCYLYVDANIRMHLLLHITIRRDDLC